MAAPTSGFDLASYDIFLKVPIPSRPPFNPQVNSSFQKRTAQGGILTILITAFLAVMLLAEWMDHLRIRHEYEFLVNHHLDHRLSTHIDVTVATECDDLTVDAIDVSGSALELKSLLSFSAVQMDVHTNLGYVHSSMRVEMKDCGGCGTGGYWEIDRGRTQGGARGTATIQSTRIGRGNAQRV
jgi:hypothetical protein